MMVRSRARAAEKAKRTSVESLTRSEFQPKTSDTKVDEELLLEDVQEPPPKRQLALAGLSLLRPLGNTTIQMKHVNSKPDFCLINILIIACNFHFNFRPGYITHCTIFSVKTTAKISVTLKNTNISTTRL